MEPETIQSVAATLRVSEKIVTQTYDIEVGMMSFDGQFDPKALETTRQSLKDLAILDFVPEIDEHVAKADEVELTVAGRRPRRKDVVPAEAHLLAQQRTDFVESVVA